MACCIVFEWAGCFPLQTSSVSCHLENFTFDSSVGPLPLFGVSLSRAVEISSLSHLQPGWRGMATQKRSQTLLSQAISLLLRCDIRFHLHFHFYQKTTTTTKTKLLPPWLRCIWRLKLYTYSASLVNTDPNRMEFITFVKFSICNFRSLMKGY